MELKLTWSGVKSAVAGGSTHKIYSLQPYILEIRHYFRCNIAKIVVLCGHIEGSYFSNLFWVQVMSKELDLRPVKFL